MLLSLLLLLLLLLLMLFMLVVVVDGGHSNACGCQLTSSHLDRSLLDR
jgi:hypothetical protein